MLYNSTQTHTKHTDLIIKSSISHKTLGVVRVERGTSETVRQTSNKWKSAGLVICGARKARPAGPSRLAHFS